jgi:hypothetical protein
MTSQADLVPPPRIATWVVSLFTPPEQAESILGDLLEEFSSPASKSGMTFARRWYWRQAVKTIAYLFGAGFRDAPWSTAAAVVGGLFLHRFVSGLPDKALSVLTDKYLFYWSAHFKTYMFLATDGMLIAQLISSMLTGCAVAMAAKGREMVATITVALVMSALIGAAMVWVATHLPLSVGWLLWSFGDPLAIVLGGVLVRTRRAHSTTVPSGA